MATCAKCGGGVGAGDRFCIHCGADLPTSVCSRCGRPAALGELECPPCAYLARRRAARSQARTIAVACVLVMVFGVVVTGTAWWVLEGAPRAAEVAEERREARQEAAAAAERRERQAAADAERRVQEAAANAQRRERREAADAQRGQREAAAAAGDRAEQRPTPPKAEPVRAATAKPAAADWKLDWEHIDTDLGPGVETSGVADSAAGSARVAWRMACTDRGEALPTSSPAVIQMQEWMDTVISRFGVTEREVAGVLVTYQWMLLGDARINAKYGELLAILAEGEVPAGAVEDPGDIVEVMGYWVDAIKLAGALTE